MIQYFFTVVALFLCYLIIICYIRPKKQHAAYIRAFENQGFKVLKVPYKLLGVPLFDQFKRDEASGDPYKTFKQQYPHYDVVVSNIMNQLFITILHPDLLKSFHHKGKHYSYPKNKKISYPLIRVCFHGGLIFSEGKAWHRKRKILNKIFNFDLIKNLCWRIAQICDRSIQQAEKKSNRVTDELIEYDLFRLTSLTFSTVIAECFLGGISEQKIDGMPFCQFFLRALDIVSEQMTEILPLIFGEKYLSLNVTSKNTEINRIIQLLSSWSNNYISEKIRAKRQMIRQLGKPTAPSDFIEALIISQEQDGEANQEQNSCVLGEKEIFQQLLTFFSAGTDTTAHFQQMLIYFLAQNPEKQTKVREEIDLYIKEDDYSFENLKKMRYIDYVQKQVTRIYGPTNFILMREANEDNLLSGIPVKKGTNLMANSFGCHFNEKYFKNPYEFRPERWQSQCQDLPVYVKGGFGGGARSCIGKHLAMLESKIALIKFVKRYEKIKIAERNFKMVLKLFYQPQDPKIRLMIKK